jgi:hypothetical protein
MLTIVGDVQLSGTLHITKAPDAQIPDKVRYRLLIAREVREKLKQVTIDPALKTFVINVDYAGRSVEIDVTRK